MSNLSAALAAGIFIWLIQVNFNLAALFDRNAVPGIVGGLIFLVLFLPVLAAISAWRVAPLTRSLGAKRTLTFSSGGLDMSFGNSKAQHLWKGIVRVEEGKHAFYFYLAKRAAIILPKRALTSKEDLDSLRALLSGAGVIVQQS